MKGLIYSYSAVIYVQGEYPCSVCGRTGIGDPMRFETDTPQYPAEVLSKFNLAKNCVIAAMPIGWAHYGDGVYKCPNCAT